MSVPEAGCVTVSFLRSERLVLDDWGKRDKALRFAWLALLPAQPVPFRAAVWHRCVKWFITVQGWKGDSANHVPGIAVATIPSAVWIRHGLSRATSWFPYQLGGIPGPCGFVMMGCAEPPAGSRASWRVILAHMGCLCWVKQSHQLVFVPVGG